MERDGTARDGKGNCPYGVVWIILILLTGLTILTNRMGMGKVSVLGPLLIASTKAGLVLFFFMHLRREPPLLKAMLGIVLVLLTSIIGFTFLDVLYR